MKGTPAIYLGKIVDKKHFRAFVYGSDGQKKLVESWNGFEAAMESGIWFATVEDAEANKKPIEDVVEDEKAKPKSRPKPKAKPKAEKVEEVDEPADELADDGTVFEVTDES